MAISMPTLLQPVGVAFWTLLILCQRFAHGFAGSQYVLDTEYSGANFFDGWDFFTDGDPTGGFTTYYSRSSAQLAGLINASSTTPAYMGVDYVNKLPISAAGQADGAGRPSVRIATQRSWTHGIFIGDFNHAPSGICGTWPAFWTLGPNWPSTGELDIMEGINKQVSNGVALHTNETCYISGDPTMQTGVQGSTNCAYYPDYNVGCGVSDSRPTSYSQFNSIGGGVYAMQWTSEYIRVWFFPRGSIPQDITNKQPNPSNWGLPAANLMGNCSIDQHVQQQKVIFDTTFCGSYAGQPGQWNSTVNSCAIDTGYATCDAYVGNEPQVFRDAYWSINYVSIYQLADPALPAPAPKYIASQQAPIPANQSPTPAPPAPSPTASLCPTYNFTTIRTSGLTYEVECDYDLPGPDIPPPYPGYVVTSFEDCVAGCTYYNTINGTNKCGGVAYDSSIPFCYFKKYINAPPKYRPGFDGVRLIFYGYPQVTDNPRSQTAVPSSAFIEIIPTPQSYRPLTTAPPSTTVSSSSIASTLSSTTTVTVPTLIAPPQGTSTSTSTSAPPTVGPGTPTVSISSTTLNSIGTSTSTVSSGTGIVLPTLISPTSLLPPTTTQSVVIITSTAITTPSLLTSFTILTTTASVPVSSPSLSLLPTTSSTPIVVVPTIIATSSTAVSAPIATTTTPIVSSALPPAPTSNSIFVPTTTIGVSPVLPSTSLTTGIVPGTTNTVSLSSQAVSSSPATMLSSTLPNASLTSPTAIISTTVASSLPTNATSMTTIVASPSNPATASSPPPALPVPSIATSSTLSSTSSTTAPPTSRPVDMTTLTSTISTSRPSDIGSFQNLGCQEIKGSQSRRNLLVLVDTSPTMTPSQCIARCSNSYYAGIRGPECYCANAALASQDLVQYPDSACNIPCPGNLNERCGGNGPPGSYLILLNLFYNTNVFTPVTSPATNTATVTLISVPQTSNLVTYDITGTDTLTVTTIATSWYDYCQKCPGYQTALSTTITVPCPIAELHQNQQPPQMTVPMMATTRRCECGVGGAPSSIVYTVPCTTQIAALTAAAQRIVAGTGPMLGNSSFAPAMGSLGAGAHTPVTIGNLPAGTPIYPSNSTRSPQATNGGNNTWPAIQPLTPGATRSGAGAILPSSFTGDATPMVSSRAGSLIFTFVAFILQVTLALVFMT